MTDQTQDQYSDDEPIESAEKDKFGRADFASRIANVVSKRSDPSSIIVGLYGAWGNGKTSVLNLIDEATKSSESLITIRFNPWLFGNVESLLMGFFHVIAEALDSELVTTGDKLKDIIKKAAPGIGAIAGAKGAGDAVGAFLHGPDINELRNRIESLLESSAKRVLIFVDDVDRLENREIHALFKLLKLTADFKYTSYIVACDKDVVSSSLAERYSGGREAGSQFLEKIIQIPLHLPSVPRSELRKYCFESVDRAINTASIELNQTQVQEYVRDFTRAFDSEISSPRRAKLYGNILLFSLPLLKGEVNPVDLMLLEGIRVFFPGLYKFLRDNKEMLTGTFSESAYSNTQQEKDRIKERIDVVLSEKDSDASQGYIELLKSLFPKLQAVYGNMHYGSDFYQQWNEAQRICSESYFDRFFTYSIPEGDFSDAAVSALLAEIEKTSPNESGSVLAQLMTEQNSGTLIRKLRTRVQSISPECAASLAIAISENSELYPNPEALFGFDNPHPQGAMLIADLVLRQDHENRVALASETIVSGATPSFQLAIFQWLRWEQEDRPEKEGFSEDQREELGAILASELAAVFSEPEKLFSEHSRVASHLFYIMNEFGDFQVVLDCLENIFNRRSETIINLLDSYTSTAWGMESGVSHKSEFERNQYDSVSKVFPVAFILKHIENHLGQLPETQESFPRDYDHKDRSLVLNQFCWLHQHVVADGK